MEHMMQPFKTIEDVLLCGGKPVFKVWIVIKIAMAVCTLLGAC